jgi:hypothetical protein
MNICPIHPQIAFLDADCPVCREATRVRELEACLAASRRERSVWLRKKEVAELLRVHRGTVKSYQDAGILPAGRLIARADVEAAITKINALRAGHARLLPMQRKEAA